jgi:hypothetical protein
MMLATGRAIVIGRKETLSAGAGVVEGLSAYTS